MEQIKQFVFNAMLVEDSLTSLVEQGISVRGVAATPPTIDLDELGFTPRILYDAQKMAQFVV
jgi:hypothetical protein